ncbi:hypothetical protein Tco_1322304 [Tanacetum coccineum]
MLSSTIESCLSYTHFFSPLTYYMAYGANEARQAIVLKLQREIQAEETLADQLSCNLARYTEETQALDEETILEEQMLALMHRFADRFTDRKVEINNLMVLHDHQLIDYVPLSFQASACSLSTLHFLKFSENSFEVLKLLENSVEVLKILENKLE